MPTTANDRAHVHHRSAQSPWDVLTTLLAATVGSDAARNTMGSWLAPTPLRRPATLRWRYGQIVPAKFDTMTRCGWFDSSQDLMQGLSVVESFDGECRAALPEPAGWLQRAQQEGMIAA